jgi:hypothetical protein
MPPRPKSRSCSNPGRRGPSAISLCANRRCPTNSSPVFDVPCIHESVKPRRVPRQRESHAWGIALIAESSRAQSVS